VTGNRRPLRLIAAGLATMIGALVLAAVLALPAEHAGLGPLADASIAESGSSNPVTAVLLNFRGYDTWLEVGVLLLAALGVLAISRTLEIPATDPERDETRLLPAAARAVALLGVIVAGYLLWRGTFAAGGAFQAGAVLGASLVLLRVAGIRTLDRLRPGILLAALTVAFVAFGGAAALTALLGGPMLTYRDEPAAVGIVLLELAIGASTAVTLALLFSLAGARR
jgi:multisubunit Na+/H+ antiporter MnhB subunit